MNKDKVRKIVHRIVLLFQQHDVSDGETQAIIDCLQAILDMQIKKFDEKKAKAEAEAEARFQALYGKDL